MDGAVGSGSAIIGSIASIDSATRTFADIDTTDPTGEIGVIAAPSGRMTGAGMTGIAEAIRLMDEPTVASFHACGGNSDTL